MSVPSNKKRNSLAIWPPKAHRQLQVRLAIPPPKKSPFLARRGMKWECLAASEVHFDPSKNESPPCLDEAVQLFFPISSTDEFCIHPVWAIAVLYYVRLWTTRTYQNKSAGVGIPPPPWPLPVNSLSTHHPRACLLRRRHRPRCPTCELFFSLSWPCPLLLRCGTGGKVESSSAVHGSGLRPSHMQRPRAHKRRPPLRHASP